MGGDDATTVLRFGDGTVRALPSTRAAPPSSAGAAASTSVGRRLAQLESEGVTGGAAGGGQVLGPVRRPLRPFRRPIRLRFTYVTSVPVKKD
jgi:hypothetical protein